MPFNAKSKKKSVQTLRQKDWICLFCQNLNFSFRQRCNRCQEQTKQKNEEMQIFFEEQQRLYFESYLSAQPSLHFPKCLFVEICEQPWEDAYCSTGSGRSRRPFQSSEAENTKWVEVLIEE